MDGKILITIYYAYIEIKYPIILELNKLIN